MGVMLKTMKPCNEKFMERFITIEPGNDCTRITANLSEFLGMVFLLSHNPSTPPKGTLWNSADKDQPCLCSVEHEKINTTLLAAIENVWLVKKKKPFQGKFDPTQFFKNNTPVPDVQENKTEQSSLSESKVYTQLGMSKDEYLELANKK